MLGDYDHDEKPETVTNTVLDEHATRSIKVGLKPRSAPYHIGPSYMAVAVVTAKTPTGNGDF